MKPDYEAASRYAKHVEGIHVSPEDVAGIVNAAYEGYEPPSAKKVLTERCLALSPNEGAQCALWAGHIRRGEAHRATLGPYSAVGWPTGYRGL